MKKNLFILLLLAFINCFSQTYTPLLKDGNKWWETYWDTSGWSFYGREYHYYYINGESVINGFIYKKIYYNKYESCWDPSAPGSCFPTNNPDEFIGLYREDVIAKKVFRYNGTDSSDDSLVYDFSKNTGETIDPSQLTIQDVVYGNVFSQNVKAFKFSQNSPLYDPYFYIFEGIGSSNGLFWYGNSSFENGNNLLCFENTSGKFCNSQLVLGTSENSIAKQLTLYYSKENQDFKIIEATSQDYQINFYESTGRLLEEVKIKGNQNFTLRNATKNKILFYTITNQGNSWKGKVLIP